MLIACKVAEYGGEVSKSAKKRLLRNSALYSADLGWEFWSLRLVSRDLPYKALHLSPTLRFETPPE